MPLDFSFNFYQSNLFNQRNNCLICIVNEMGNESIFTLGKVLLDIL